MTESVKKQQPLRSQPGYKVVMRSLEPPFSLKLLLPKRLQRRWPPRLEA